MGSSNEELRLEPPLSQNIKISSKPVVSSHEISQSTKN